MFNTIAIRTMCLKCVKKGKKECDHVAEERPHWRTGKGEDIQVSSTRQSLVSYFALTLVCFNSAPS